jgi:hypothetical protein
MIDDGSTLPTPAPEIPSEKKYVSLLTTVALDGSTFMDDCNVPSWRNQLRTLVIDTLSISNFTAPGADLDDDDERFDLYALTRTFVTGTSSSITLIRHGEQAITMKVALRLN